jgi:hypothetical protein
MEQQGVPMSIAIMFSLVILGVITITAMIVTKVLGL